MSAHIMGPSRLNHGLSQCTKCLATDREIAFALGPVCPVPDQPATPSPATLQVPDSAGNAMRERVIQAAYKALRNYKMSNMAQEDDHHAGYPLVDLCSRPDGDISDGEEQIGEMAADVADAILALPLDGRADVVERAQATIRDALLDSNYLAGAKAAWNAAQAPDPEAAYAALVASRAGHMVGYADAKAAIRKLAGEGS